MRLRVFLAGLLCAGLLHAAVTRVEVKERADLPIAGFERIAGTLHFALDPSLEANKAIVDLTLAPRNAQGLVEFTSDFLVFRPKDPARSNGTLLYESVNRGSPLMWTGINIGAGSKMQTADDMGDAFLLHEGYTLLWVGWQFDVAEGEGRFKVHAPKLPDVTGPVRLEVLPTKRQTSEPLPFAPADNESGSLSVRDAAYGPRTVLPRNTWRFSADHSKVEFPGGLTAGRVYDFVYTAKGSAVAGVGFAAVRDYVSYVKANGIQPNQNRPRTIIRALGLGISQSGRMLRTFLHEGFNADEQGKQVFDGVWAHVAGAGNGGFNQRFAQPGRVGGQYSGSFYPSDLPPFSPAGLLEKATAAGVAPRLFLSNGSQEYWGRAAALNHITPDGSKDLDPPSNVRIYYIAGTQHGAGGGAPDPNVQNRTNSMAWVYFLRATLRNLQAWVAQNTEPPPTNVPRMDRGQLVAPASIRFPYIPGFAVVNSAYAPRRLDFGPDYVSRGIVTIEPPHASGAYPVMVPQVNTDGNELAGIRMPALSWPLATHTGWNLRNESVGAPQQQFSLIGSQAPFARTKAEREKSGDPRLSISERYRSRAEYLDNIESAAQTLAAQHFVLTQDVPRLVELAGRRWDEIMLAQGK